MKIYMLVNIYLVSPCIKFYQDPWINVRARVVNVRAHSGSSTQFGSSLEIMRKLQQLSTTPTDGSAGCVNILFTHLNRWNFRSGWNRKGFTFVVRREGIKASNTRKRWI